MKKKDYQKPEMRVVLLQQQSPLLQASINNVDSGDTGIGYGGGNSGGGRVKQNDYNVWDDDWSE